MHIVVLGGLGVVGLGLAGMLLRRTITSITLSGSLAGLGLALSLAGVGIERDDPTSVAAGVVVLVLSAAWCIAGVALSAAAFRRRGTVQLDELRELRG